MVQQKSLFRRGILFFFLLLTITPLVLFPIRSAYCHEPGGLPKVEGGVLDLREYDLSQGGKVPLDGTWEFFAHRWIVSDPEADRSPDLLAPVPQPWHLYPGLDLAPKGIGSYRITIRNCPPSQQMVVFIPSTSTCYRAYIDGVLVAARGSMALRGVTFSGEGAPFKINPITSGVAAPPGGTVELVIEVASPDVGGLYQAPLLMEKQAYYVRYDLRNMLASAIISVTLVAIACFACLLLMGDKLFSSYGLLLLDLMVFLRILFRSSCLEVMNHSALMGDYFINKFFQVVSLFLPAVFLLCMRQLLQFPVRNKRLAAIVCYDLVLTPFILWAAMTGRLYLTFALYLAGCLPFLVVFYGLYERVKSGTPYALEISATLFAVFASVLGSSLVGSGLLVIDISLFPSTCFMVSMVLQLWIMLRRSIEVQRRAVEAENLRLRLKQSESALMLSQIKPHFLYNTLIAIHTLCTDAPETAAEATLKFATFLRGNMNLIGRQEFIPFEKELEHIRNYADIELLRHQRRLTVRYEIDVTDFSVPPLSIQPIVENAIRHGACKNITGGTVTLRTYETDTHLAVEVMDDGPGFDPAAALAPTEEPHGLQNILFRLKHHGAQVELDAAPGRGTRVLVSLPKEGTV